MNTYRYCIEEIADKIWRVTEEDGPTALATGDYDSLISAQQAVETVADQSLAWEAGIHAEGSEEETRYWVSEFTEAE